MEESRGMKGSREVGEVRVMKDGEAGDVRENKGRRSWGDWRK